MPELSMIRRMEGLLQTNTADDADFQGSDDRHNAVTRPWEPRRPGGRFARRHRAIRLLPPRPTLREGYSCKGFNVMLMVKEATMRPPLL